MSSRLAPPLQKAYPRRVETEQPTLCFRCSRPTSRYQPVGRATKPRAYRRKSHTRVDQKRPDCLPRQSSATPHGNPTAAVATTTCSRQVESGLPWGEVSSPKRAGYTGIWSLWSTESSFLPQAFIQITYPVGYKPRPRPVPAIRWPSPRRESRKPGEQTSCRRPHRASVLR